LSQGDALFRDLCYTTLGGPGTVLCRRLKRLPADLPVPVGAGKHPLSLPEEDAGAKREQVTVDGAGFFQVFYHQYMDGLSGLFRKIFLGCCGSREGYGAI
jgi:hypothetical protein